MGERKMWVGSVGSIDALPPIRHNSIVRRQR
jgi:hypothetical protein